MTCFCWYKTTALGEIVPLFTLTSQSTEQQRNVAVAFTSVARMAA